MTPPEFSRRIALDTLGEGPRQIAIEADEAERAALAKRFDLIDVSALMAAMALIRSGDAVTATGRVEAMVTQSCIASGTPVAARIDEPFKLEFRPMPTTTSPDDEVELGEGDLDVVFHDGAAIDIGEAVAQSLSLAVEAYPRAPKADAALKAAGVKDAAQAGPFGALAGLNDKLSGSDRAS